MKRAIGGARAASCVVIPAFTLALLVAGAPCNAEEVAGLLVRPVDDAVLVEGVQPGSQVVLLGVIRGVVGNVPGFERWVGTAVDDDGDGSVTVTLEAPIEADRSVWAVVDVKTMAWAMSQPVVGGSPLALPVAATLPVGARDWTVDIGKAEVLVVRPGDGLAGPGIWAGPAWDGGPLDADGAHDGSVRVQVKDLEAVAGSSVPAPLTLEAGDLLVAFQPEVFYPFVARVEGGGQ